MAQKREHAHGDDDGGDRLDDSDHGGFEHGLGGFELFRLRRKAFGVAVGADGGEPDGAFAAYYEASGEKIFADGFEHRVALAGYKALVKPRFAGDYDGVGGNLVPGADDYYVPEHQLPAGENHLFSVPDRPCGGGGEDGKAVNDLFRLELLYGADEKVRYDDSEEEHIAVAAGGCNEHRQHKVEHIVERKEVRKPDLLHAL